MVSYILVILPSVAGELISLVTSRVGVGIGTALVLDTTVGTGMAVLVIKFVMTGLYIVVDTKGDEDENEATKKYRVAI